MPFLTVLAPSGRYHGTRDRRPQRLLDRARQALRFVRRWPPLGASGRGRSHKAPEWLDAVRETVCHHAREPIRGALSAGSTVEAEAKRGAAREGSTSADTRAGGRQLGDRLERLTTAHRAL
jgi:hypothetical protein